MYMYAYILTWYNKPTYLVECNTSKDVLYMYICAMERLKHVTDKGKCNSV
jgi:hypothetical protein